MNIGCLFGTFDPPHNGHLAIADQMLSSVSLDEVWLVVTPLNPFKHERSISSDKDRSEMVRLAVQDHPGLVASDAELLLPRPNYTVDTLVHFRSRWPEHTFSLIIGSDNLAVFHRWKDPDLILARHRLLVYPRAGGAMDPMHAGTYAHPSVRVVPAPLMDLSSTYIRQRIAEGKDVHGTIPPLVEAYIRQRGLYRAAAANT